MKISRLKHLAQIAVSNVDKKSSDAEPLVRLCNYTDVYYNETITSELPFMEATASIDQVRRLSLRGGDVLVTKDSETPDDIGVPAHVPYDLPGVVCGYHLALLRPQANVAGRYLFWALKSQPARQKLSASANGITRFGLRYEAFGEVQVPLPSLDRQRAIADYLDAETARIDALIEKKRRLVGLLTQRRDHQISSTLWQGEFMFMRLKYLSGRPTSGNRDHGSFIPTDEGVPCLRGLNVRPGRVDRGDLLYIKEEDHRRHNASALHSGDLVIVRSGLAGSATVIPDDLDNCNCVDLVIIRGCQGLASKYLEYVINSRETQEQVRLKSTGALLTHFNADQSAELSVPFRALEEQQRIAAELDRIGVELDRLMAAIEQQLVLLTEHRQAIITAAVAGELDIPGVAA